MHFIDDGEILAQPCLSESDSYEYLASNNPKYLSAYRRQHELLFDDAARRDAWLL